MFKRNFLVFAALVCLCGNTALASAGAPDSYSFWNDVARSAAAEAWRLMGEKPADMLVLTNAGYAVSNGQTTEACLDGLAEASGCTIGRNSLLEVHSSREKPLWFVFFNKKTGNSAYLEVNAAAIQTALQNGGGKLMPTALFSKAASSNIGMEQILARPNEWNEKVKTKIFNGNEFAIVTFCNAAAHGAPQDFLKAALYHDHLCPGVNSGYLLANYLVREFPLRNSNEKYYIISSPQWCKEDALQTLLNTTPGKSGMAVIPVNAETKARLIPEAKNLAGIYIRWNEKEQRGDGVVLSFDFNKGAVLAGLDNKQGFPWESKLKLDIWYQNYYDKPEVFIGPIKSFVIENGEKPEDYSRTGVNPLEKLQLLQP